MGNSLLAVRDIDHKYIVVEKKKSDIKMRMLLFLFFEIFDVKCDQVTVNGFLMG